MSKYLACVFIFKPEGLWGLRAEAVLRNFRLSVSIHRVGFQLDPTSCANPAFHVCYRYGNERNFVPAQRYQRCGYANRP